MPGWYRFSWAYHGDDGALFVNARPDYFPVWSAEPSDDFGSDGEFGSTNTAGVGLNLETGEGFVTLNGERRDVGKSLKRLYEQFDKADYLQGRPLKA